MLVLSSQSTPLQSNTVIWLCVPERVRTFQKGRPANKAKLRRWWTYLSQLQLSLHHIQGVKKECADYISCHKFDDMIGARTEELGKEPFSRMDVHLDLNVTMIRPLDGLQCVENLKQFGDIYERLEKRLQPVLVNQDQWNRIRPISGMRTRTSCLATVFRPSSSGPMSPLVILVKAVP